VAAGWAVDDEAASVFAEAFYASLLRNNRFIVAVGEARAAAYRQSPHLNTWAAYQCYGDPDWVFRRVGADANQATAPPSDDFSGVGSAASLKLELQRVFVQTKFQGADLTLQLNKLRKLEEVSESDGRDWGKNGDVAELFGDAFVEAGAVESGMQWYERAVAADDGRASMKAAEQLANVRSRLAWDLVDKAARYRADMVAREKQTPERSKARAAARRARVDAERSLIRAVERAGELIQASLDLLEKLNDMEETMERANLVGSAYKRRALVAAAARRPRTEVERDLREMKARYEHAEHVGRTKGAHDLYYSVSNCLGADVALNAGRPKWRTLDPRRLAILRKSLEEKSGSGADFWSEVGKAELRQYEALANRRLAAARAALERDYRDLYKRVTSTRMWGSVYDTACLVLPGYADRAARTSRKEKDAAIALLEQLRGFAHPTEDTDA
jgi:hypothetical protein